MFKKVHVFRVKPGEELVAAVSAYCRERAVTSGIIMGTIGSASKATITFLEALPGHYTPRELSGPLEIVAAQGSVALLKGKTIVHIHIQLASREGCWGGHLASATVFSTAEVAIGELNYQLQRQPDSYTGLNELRENS
ncbi:PPC domain-containing DNA-binding protein [Chloroflexota bacterium]